MLENNDMYGDIFEQIIPIGLFHMDGIEADIQFDAFEGQYQYETESRGEILEGVKELVEMWKEVQEKGINIKQLLEMLDAQITIDASVGEWKSQALLRLKNLDKFLLKAYEKFMSENSDDEKPSKSYNPHPQQLIMAPPPQ